MGLNSKVFFVESQIGGHKNKKTSYLKDIKVNW